MKKQLLIPLFIVGVLTSAQNKVNKEELQKIAEEQRSIYEQSLLIEMNKLGKTESFLEQLGFQGIYDGVPVYYTTEDSRQISSMNVDALHEGNVENGVAVSGDGMVVYIWDGGKVRTTHQELVDRVEIVEQTGSNSDHATAVAGVIGSSGRRPMALGMAPDVLIKSLNFTNGTTSTEIATQSADPLNSKYMVSNHSYGNIVGWYYGNQGPGTGWYWFGNPTLSETEDAQFGYYSSSDAFLDRTLYNAPQHSVFKSSGNNNNEGPGGVVNHYVRNNGGSWILVNDGTFRPNDCIENGGGYDCLSSSGTMAKNNIVVGAIRPLGGDNRYESPSDVVATSFSSFGPTDDGRIKPEITAIGQSVYSPTNTSDVAYLNWNGTSFSSPAAAGVGVLLQQVKKQQTNGAEYLRSDMMKAILTHSAFESGEHLGPDYKFGYGLINALGAAEIILNSNRNSITENRVLLNQETQTVTVTAKGDEPLKVSIAWLDPAGAATSVALNDRTPKLVNDVDLRVSNGGTTYLPWKLDPENPAAAAIQADNVVDNLEQVFVENPIAGQTYTITISHKGELKTPITPVPEVTYQNYALVITGVDAPLAVQDLDLDKSVSIYPNPVVDNLNIKVNTKLTNANIKVFNAVGQVVFQNDYKSMSNNQSIDLKSMSSGVYMVYIKSDEGTITKKIIKK